MTVDLRSLSLTGLRVLVVEDHEDSREVLRQTLAYLGAVVIAAARARDAVASLNDVDVVVTDYAMPGETGGWLAEQVRARPRAVPVIVVTGYADYYAEALRAVPLARLLRKPVDAWTVCREIRAVTGRA
jgi:CheY-like chemotaxis protein